MKLRELHEEAQRSVTSYMGQQPEHCFVDFNCADRHLTSLEGSPRIIDGGFCCTYNANLTSLEGGPERVAKDYQAFNCGLTSLKGLASVIGGQLDLHRNKKLKSLVGCPRNVFTLDVHDCGITSLEGLPESINGSLNLNGNKLTNLHNIHKHVKYIGSSGRFARMKITSHVLGLILIDGLKMVTFDDVVGADDIINKYLLDTPRAADRDIIACQDELIDAGYEEYAQL